MRILVLTKRQYTNKDLIDDKYGRLYELPEELARLGHQVSGLCLSYRFRNEGHLLGPKINGSMVNWYSVNVGKFIGLGIRRYLKVLSDLCLNLMPDIILASSDAFHIIYGVHVAKKKHIPCVVDLYDNYESFGLSKLPGMMLLFRKALQNATAVLCVSDALKKYIKKAYSPKGKVSVLTNGIPLRLFRPLDKRKCRRQFGLPLDVHLIGTAGTLGPSRDTEIVLQAANKLILEDPSIHLVLAGHLESGISLSRGTNIHYLGVIEYEQVPLVFNALDVGIISNSTSDFGRYCFPQKAYEMMACGLPIVAAKVGAMESLLQSSKKALYEPQSSNSLQLAVQEQLEISVSPAIKVKTWADLAKELESVLRGIIMKPRAPV